MDLTLSDLSTLIRLVEKESQELEKLIKNSDGEILEEDVAKCLVEVGNVEGKLKRQYESLWSSDCNYSSYQELLDSM